LTECFFNLLQETGKMRFFTVALLGASLVSAEPWQQEYSNCPTSEEYQEMYEDLTRPYFPDERVTACQGIAELTHNNNQVSFGVWGGEE
jgi:hypothetical protein